MKALRGVVAGAALVGLGCNGTPASSPSTSASTWPSTPTSSSTSTPTPPSTSTSTSPSTSTSTPTSSPSASASAVPDDVYCGPAQAEFGALKCHWRTIMKGYCGGAAPPPGMTKPHRECVCDTCTADSDCADKAKGRCQEFLSASFCGTASKVCVYPGDACYPPGKCAKTGQSCLQTQGKATCAPPPQPVP